MTPEKALGRLINLREQFATDCEHDKKIHVKFCIDCYCENMDDFDDIIRSIERGMKTGVCSNCIINGVSQAEPPDSEDMEPRTVHYKGYPPKGRQKK